MIRCCCCECLSRQFGCETPTIAKVSQPFWRVKLLRARSTCGISAPLLFGTFGGVVAALINWMWNGCLTHITASFDERCIIHDAGWVLLLLGHAGRKRKDDGGLCAVCSMALISWMWNVCLFHITASFDERYAVQKQQRNQWHLIFACLLMLRFSTCLMCLFYYFAVDGKGCATSRARCHRTSVPRQIRRIVCRNEILCP